MIFEACYVLGKAFALWEGPLSYQFVGEVMAYQDYDG